MEVDRSDGGTLPRARVGSSPDALLLVAAGPANDGTHTPEVLPPPGGKGKGKRPHGAAAKEGEAAAPAPDSEAVLRVRLHGGCAAAGRPRGWC